MRAAYSVWRQNTRDGAPMVADVCRAPGVEDIQRPRNHLDGAAGGMDDNGNEWLVASTLVPETLSEHVIAGLKWWRVVTWDFLINSVRVGLVGITVLSAVAYFRGQSIVLWAQQLARQVLRTEPGVAAFSVAVSGWLLNAACAWAALVAIERMLVWRWGVPVSTEQALELKRVFRSVSGTETAPAWYRFDRRLTLLLFTMGLGRFACVAAAGLATGLFVVDTFFAPLVR